MRTLTNVGKTLILLAAVTAVIQLVGIAIWPGQLTWTGWLLCPDGQPDAAVVTTSGEVIIQPAGQGPRTVQGWTPSLVCRGGSEPPTVVGSLRPALVLAIPYAAVITLVTLDVVFRPSELRRVAREMAEEEREARWNDGSTPGPFVD